MRPQHNQHTGGGAGRRARARRSATRKVVLPPLSGLGAPLSVHAGCSWCTAWCEPAAPRARGRRSGAEACCPGWGVSWGAPGRCGPRRQRQPSWPRGWGGGPILAGARAPRNGQSRPPRIRRCAWLRGAQRGVRRQYNQHTGWGAGRSARAELGHSEGGCSTPWWPGSPHCEYVAVGAGAQRGVNRPPRAREGDGAARRRDARAGGVSWGPLRGAGRADAGGNACCLVIADHGAYII